MKNILMLSLVGMLGTNASFAGSSDEEMKQILIGAWSAGSGYVVFEKNEKFNEYDTNYLIEGWSNKPFAGPKSESHKITSGEWYLTDKILKKRYLTAEGKGLARRQQMYQTCTLQSISADEFQCHYLVGNKTITWRRMKSDSPK